MENVDSQHYLEGDVEAQKDVEVASTLVVGFNGGVGLDKILQIAHEELNLVFDLNYVKG